MGHRQAGGRSGRRAGHYHIESTTVRAEQARTPRRIAPMKLRIDDPWMPAPEYGRMLRGLTVNLLVRDIEASLAFQRAVLRAEVVYADPDIAVVRGYGGEWMLHADHTYRGHPMHHEVAAVTPRGIGDELRLPVATRMPLPPLLSPTATSWSRIPPTSRMECAWRTCGPWLRVVADVPAEPDPDRVHRCGGLPVDAPDSPQKRSYSAITCAPRSKHERRDLEAQQHDDRRRQRTVDEPSPPTASRSTRPARDG